MAQSHPVYLIVADSTAEFQSALHYAVRAAQANGARVAVLNIMEEQDFSHWGAVEDQMRRELRQEAEEFLLEVADKIKSLGGMLPVFHLEQGDPIKAVLHIIGLYPNITKLILGGDTHSAGPGPLVSHFAGKGMNQLNIPITVIPDHIPAERIDDLV